jgi:tRNA-2-methylthio-N6-dimethylallyladenosine synthase
MRASVYIETLGCQMNVADSERAATRLRAAGYDLTGSAETADVVLFNTCSVRARAAQKVFTRIGDVRRARRRSGREPLLGLLGCVAQLEGASLFDEEPALSLVAGTRATDRLPSLIERALGGDDRTLDLGERAHPLPRPDWEQFRPSEPGGLSVLLSSRNRYAKKMADAEANAAK